MALPRLRVLCLIAFAASAQTPAPGGYVLRFDVDLVQVDVVVTDSHGKHVPSLTPNDFEALQDGKAQTITHFSYVSGKPPAGTKTLHAPSPITAPTAAEVSRTIVFLIDDKNMSFGDFAFVRTALKRFVDGEMHPNDMVALIRTSNGSGAAQVFTSDSHWLSNTVDRMFWRPGGSLYPPMLADLTAIIRELASYPGRKSIVLIGPGFLTGPDGWNAARKLADAANRASVTIETIDSRGLPVLLFQNSSPYFHSQDILAFLAQMTAGLFQHDRNDIAAEVRDAVNDADGYYLLGWYPGAQAFRNNPHAPLPYHHVQVRLRNVRGLSTRTRDGFFAHRGSDAEVVYSPAQQMNAALFSPFRSGDIDVRLTAALGYDDRNGAYIESLLRIRPGGVEFHDVAGQPDCKLFDLQILTIPEPLDFSKVPKGKLNTSHARITLCRSNDGRLDELLHNGIVALVRDPISVPGGYRMLAAVRNWGAGDAPPAHPAELASGSGATPSHILVGSANQLIDVPDMRKQDMVLTGIKLESGHFQEPPQNEAAFYRVASPNDPAVREFHPGETLSYSFRLLRSQKRSTEPAEVRVQILHEDKQVYAAEPRSVTPGETVTGTYTLDASAEAGHYLLEASSGRATQWIDFEVK